MHILVALILPQLLWASTNSADLYEKTFPRDNTFCKLGKSRVEFSIRGFSKYTEPRDRGYGELLFLEQGKNRQAIDIAQGNSGLYRFFRGTGTTCSKYQAYDLDESTFALLLMKANRPHKDKIVIQLFDRNTLSPLKIIHSDLLGDRSIPTQGGFFVRTNGERLDMDMGTIKWDDKKFTYQDRDFQEWVYFNKDGFSLSEKATYEQFPYKRYFSDQEDFLKSTGWSAEEKKFKNKVLYVAINHGLQKECILILPNRQKLTGSEEAWRCLQK